MPVSKQVLCTSQCQAGVGGGGGGEGIGQDLTFSKKLLSNSLPRAKM